ncbi:hypothetical protein M427DRAFT_217667 [Gonapodya prolifera JEL478]|uniref:Uncharacterized protein n=1 Tax=Gonapodya prolifera (strain JEL478) TaxID=1344416 RepID=A0A138ZYU9_GONPJ|nr:hypothetical protein M427DRAFT_217667 [Gonapodya prolifera JEL478]|eukprot:KXS09679.1 hypothetical protein M427DRAFT_217667 [Gonapodya prolifera JEL478]
MATTQTAPEVTIPTPLQKPVIVGLDRVDESRETVTVLVAPPFDPPSVPQEQEHSEADAPYHHSFGPQAESPLHFRRTMRRLFGSSKRNQTSSSTTTTSAVTATPTLSTPLGTAEGATDGSIDTESDYFGRAVANAGEPGDNDPEAQEGVALTRIGTGLSQKSGQLKQRVTFTRTLKSLVSDSPDLLASFSSSRSSVSSTVTNDLGEAPTVPELLEHAVVNGYLDCSVLDKVKDSDLVPGEPGDTATYPLAPGVWLKITRTGSSTPAPSPKEQPIELVVSPQPEADGKEVPAETETELANVEKPVAETEGTASSGGSPAQSLLDQKSGNSVEFAIQVSPLTLPGTARAAAHDSCVLFPSFATYDPEDDEWDVDIRGWVYRKPPAGPASTYLGPLVARLIPTLAPSQDDEPLPEGEDDTVSASIDLKDPPKDVAVDALVRPEEEDGTVNEERDRRRREVVLERMEG